MTWVTVAKWWKEEGLMSSTCALALSHAKCFEVFTPILSLQVKVKVKVSIRVRVQVQVQVKAQVM